MTTQADLEQWRELGLQLRVDSIRSSSAAGSGHPTSSMSAADLLAVLMSKYLHYDFGVPENPNNDHLIFSKGHASPLLYAVYKAAGAISDQEMLTFRKFGSRIEGHPTPVLPWVDVATGSLGQGLPIAVGVALAAKKLDRLPYRVWVLCGDSEMAEGSIWEAFEHAAFNGLDNLTAVIDVNRLGQTGPTMHQWDIASYAKRAKAFGWNAIEIDGHDPAAIDRAYAKAIETNGAPTVIVARTVKGSGVKAVADKNGFHGKPLADPEAAIAELGGMRDIHVEVSKPESSRQPHRFGARGPLSLPSYELGSKEATRKAFGDALVALGAARGDVVVIDGEVGNSTYTEQFAEAHGDRFFQSYIAEQQMIATAVGMQVRGWKPFAATFAAFLSRAYDFVRMAAVSRANLAIAGSHAGVSIGEDGPSQMALEDLASYRAIHGSTVLYPSDPNQAAALVAQMADRAGVVFMRTTREKTPVIYAPDEAFHIGGSRVVRQTDDDALAIVAAGITLHEAIRAADQLGEEGINVRLIDAYTVKPIDAETLRVAAEETGRILTVEDHWPEGGIGDAVLEALADAGAAARVTKLAVRSMPGSGTPAELLAAAGIDAAHIVTAARELAGQGPAVAARSKSDHGGGNEEHDMSGAEQDRREAASVDQDREAGRVIERANEDGARSALGRLYDDQEQSPWIDFIDRELIESGKLDDLIGTGIRGLTSNPTIFAKAIGSRQYDELIRRELEGGSDNQRIFEAIEVRDIKDACDHLRSVYDASGGTDGFASIEVEPTFADDTDATVRRARQLWEAVDRPNVFIKIPATQAGVPAIEQAIGDGINVNVTLMFSVEVYEHVARAYIAGLRRRLADGGQLSRIASVASFFVSRVDTKVDKQLDEIGTRAALEARGRAAIANAKLAYQSYLDIFEGAEFADLRNAGAQVQRCLWASTSTKNPDYRDVLYVEELIGPATVNTMPTDTITAFVEHGRVERTLDRGVDDARAALRAVEAVGVSMRTVTDELIAEGVASFAKSFDELIASIESQRSALAPA